MAAACRVVVVVVMLLGAAVSGGMARAQDTGAADVACGLNQRITQRAPGGGWVISRPNAFNTSGQRLCISGSTSHPGFTILDNLRFTGAWQAYPFTGAGCAFQLCSPYTELPIQVRELPAPANTSFSWTGSAPGNWNVSYDIWFDHHNQITAQDDGAELMIWLRPNPGYRGGVRVHISNRWYWFMHWQTCNSARQMGVTPPRVSLGTHAGTCWNYVQFRFLNVVHSVRRLWIMPFIRFLEARGLVRPSWWLTSVHAGYELVSGGKGLTTTGFNVDHLTRPWSTRQASQAAAQASRAVDVFYKAADTTLGHRWYDPRLGWRGPVSMGSQEVSGQPSVITSVSGTLDALWQGADGGLWHQYTNRSGWSGQFPLNMGTLGGPPKAVAQPDGTEDVFWRGAGNDHLWHTYFVPGSGWRGAQSLGGDLSASTALVAPVSAAPGTVDVFWKGTDGNMWHAYTTAGHRWTAPVSLGMGPLGSMPFATAGPNGTEDVFWRGTGNDHLWHAYFRAGDVWRGPQDLGGDLYPMP